MCIILLSQSSQSALVYFNGSKSDHAPAAPETPFGPGALLLEVGCSTLPPQPGGPAEAAGRTADDVELGIGVLYCPPSEEVCGTSGGRPLKELAVKASGEEVAFGEEGGGADIPDRDAGCNAML